VVMMISASTSSWSNFEFSPSLSEVVTSVWPCSSSQGRMPSSFSVVPRSSGTWIVCERKQLREDGGTMVGRRAGRTYIFGMLATIVEHEEYLDLFTISCQRCDPSQVLSVGCASRRQRSGML